MSNVFLFILKSKAEHCIVYVDDLNENDEYIVQEACMVHYSFINKLYLKTYNDNHLNYIIVRTAFSSHAFQLILQELALV